jgi:ComF family protein
MLLKKLQEEIPCVDELPDCLLPVPLHSSRLRQRGFNQSIEIARVIAKRLQIPIVHDAVIRRRSTESQTGLTAKQRQKNIRGAFDVVGDLAGKHVLIIDDVVTTGSTVNELAKVLKRKGVKRVGVLSIARAPIKT